MEEIKERYETFKLNEPIRGSGMTRVYRSAPALGMWFVVALLTLAGPSVRCFAGAPWVTLQGGHFLVKRSNDGDSFHISVAGTEYIFRLYFVDAPETTAEFRDRVEEQANYFGITVDRNLELGELAKTYTREKLSGPFLVRTCWEDAMGRSRIQRFFAFVQTNSGDLGEQLIDEILAATRRAQENPELFRIVRRDGNVRRVLTKRFPYRIFFSVVDEILYVHAVLHGARHDRRWTERL